MLRVAVSFPFRAKRNPIDCCFFCAVLVWFFSLHFFIKRKKLAPPSTHQLGRKQRPQSESPSRQPSQTLAPSSSPSEPHHAKSLKHLSQVVTIFITTGGLTSGAWGGGLGL